MARTSHSDLVIRQRLTVLTRALPAARSGNVEAIHRARVATRRLREALPLVSGGSTGRKLEKVARRLTRALGAVRELDVALMTLDELEAGGEAPGAGLIALRRVIEEERERLRADMARQVERVNLGKLERKALASGRHERSGGSRAGPGPRQTAAVLKRAGRRAAALHAAVDNAGGIYLPDRLHQVRIAAKKLRYTLEIARELHRTRPLARELHRTRPLAPALHGPRALARIRTLKAVQDLLGRMHDLEVLIMRIRALQGSDRAPDLKASADLDRLVRRLETDCRQLHVRYMGFKKKLLELCHDVGSRQ